MSWFCDGLIRRGHSIQVLTAQSEAEENSNAQNSVRVDRDLLGISDDSSPRRILFQTARNVSAVKRAIQKTRPDIVLCGAFDGIGFDCYQTSIGQGRPSLTWLGDTWSGQAWRNLPLYDRWTGIVAGRRRGRAAGLGRTALYAVGHVVGLRTSRLDRGYLVQSPLYLSLFWKICGKAGRQCLLTRE